MGYLKKRIKLFLFKKKWRKLNAHNNTFVLDLFPPKCMEVGRFSYGGLKVLTFGDEYKVKIGDFCSVGPNVLFVLQADHYVDRVSTFPFKVKALGKKNEAISKGNIILEDDVWIGANVTVLSGVHIGQGAVVSAGAVVTKDVPPYSIVGGVPARIIKYRFDEDIIKELLNINYKKVELNDVVKNIDKLYEPVNGNNYKVIVNILTHQ